MWLRVAVLGGVVLFASSAAAVLVSAARWDSGTVALRHRIASGRRTPPALTVQLAELDALPAPVQRYLRAVLTEGAPVIGTVRLAQTGRINLGETVPKWAPFTATQYVVTYRPGFDWDARIRMAPGVTVRVHDAYADGRGRLQARLLGLIPVADVEGDGAAARGELLRYLAEAVWYPTAFLPSQGVTWTAVSETSAEATLRDGEVTVSLVFTFGPDDLVRTVRTESRDRLLGAVSTPTPWGGQFWNYAVRDGMRVPLEGAVAWYPNSGEYPYWQGRMTEVQYDFVQ